MNFKAKGEKEREKRTVLPRKNKLLEALAFSAAERSWKVTKP
jgi:hypothetical protein